MADLVLDWGLLGAYGTALADTSPDAVTTTVDTGGVAVDITFTAQEPSAQAFTFNGEGYVADGETFDPMSHLKLFGEQGVAGTVSATSNLVLNFRSTDDMFTDSVQNVSFRLSDIDGATGEDLDGPDGPGSFQDNVTILAYDADGNAVEVDLASSGAAATSGDTAIGTVETNFNSADGSVLVTIAGPITRIEVVYENGGDAAQGALISDVEFSTVDVDDNTPPIAFDDDGETETGVAITIDALSNDVDPDGDPLTIVSNTDPANGSVVDNGDGTFTYTPDAGFTGTDTFEYEVTDPSGATDTGLVTVVVDDPNNPPVAEDDEATTEPGVTVDVPVLFNDSDPDGDPILITELTAANGTVTDNGDGTVAYTPDPGFEGEDTISYTIADPDGATDSAVAIVTVADPNSPPVAADDAETTDIGTPVTIDALANDSDPDGDPISITFNTDPANGSVVDNGDGTFTYTPDAGFVGTDTFEYDISDTSGDTDTAVVTITVEDPNAPPVAEDDALTVPNDETTDIPVLDNDSDPDGDPLTVTDVTDPANGTASVNPDGTIAYTPDAGFVGEDTITYTIEDPSGATDTADVIITVEPGNTPPVAVDDAETTEVGTPVIIDALGNDSDPDGDAITITFNTDPANGSVVDNGDGTFTYTPDAGFVGTDTFEYDISDTSGDTDTAVVTVTVEEPNAPPVAEDDTAETDEGETVVIPVLDNDSDPDGDPLTVTGVTDPANGTATVNPDGTVSYTPDPGFTGDDTITYTVEDPSGATDTADIVVTVSPPNQPPVAEDDTADTEEGETVIVPVLDNDDDPDGDPLTVTDVTDPTNGTATVNPDGTISYTPNPGFIGDDTITYTVTDPDGATDTADVVVTVSEPSDPGRIDTDVFPVDPADQSRDPLDGLDEDPDPSDDLDAVAGTGGADTISTGDDDDTIVGGAGDDVIRPGIDDDLVSGGTGNDLIEDVQGADTIFGGQGDDTIIAGIDTFSDYAGDDPSFAPGTLLNDLGFDRDPNQEDGRDSVQGNRGADVISTGDDRDTIDGGGENDTIDAGIDDDLVMGGQGDDSIIGGHGSDTLDGGQGDDYIDGSNIPALELTDDVDAVPENDRDDIFGALGNDTLIGGDDDDTLRGGSGNDSLDGGIDDDVLLGGNDDDTLEGGQGDDTLNGGEGADSIDGGADRDVVVVDSPTAGIDDTVQGGFEGDDFDTLDLTGAGDRGEDWRLVDVRPDDDGPGRDPNGIDGTVEFLDGAGNVTGTMDFFNIEQVVPCFTPGTVIATPQGERLVEELREGDRIITRDNGIQEIRWVGRKDLTGHVLARKPHMKPILIQKGSLGNGLPEHDMLVSPNHRVLVNNDKTALYFEEREVLAAAKHLTGLKGVDEVSTLGVSYIHFMFDRHEVVLSNGAWTESFQPGDYSLKGIGNAQRTEILELFPELEHAEGINAYSSARRSLKKHEAKLLTK